MGGQFGFCDVEVGVLINVFEVLGVSAVGRADGLLLEDEAVQKITQITIRILVALVSFCSHIFFFLKKAYTREFFNSTVTIQCV